MPLITSTDSLKKRCQELKNEPYITVDTEFLRDKHYYPKLCLIQIAAPNTKEFAIDTLAENIDLEPVFEIFQNPNIIKVFHSAKQDIEIILNHSSQVPFPLFDTQVAAMVCGFGDSVSYAKLARELANARIDKSSRFTDWARRPLSEKQINYALSDVTHLKAIYATLKEKIDNANRKHWLSEEMDILTNPKTYEVNREKLWKKFSRKAHSKEFLGILRAVTSWREDVAIELNRPRNHILKDHIIIEIAGTQPTTIKKLHEIRGLPRFKKQKEQELLELIITTLNLPEDQLPEIETTTIHAEKETPLVDLLKVLLRTKAKEYHVAEKLIAHTKDLVKLATEDNPKIYALSGWRYEIFGEDALKLKQGKLALAAHNDRVSLIKL